MRALRLELKALLAYRVSVLNIYIFDKDLVVSESDLAKLVVMSSIPIWDKCLKKHYA